MEWHVPESEWRHMCSRFSVKRSQQSQRPQIKRSVTEGMWSKETDVCRSKAGRGPETPDRESSARASHPLRQAREFFTLRILPWSGLKNHT